MNKLNTLLIAALLGGVSLNAQIFSEDFEGGVLPAGWTVTTNATDGGFLVSPDGTSGAVAIPATSIYAHTNDDDCNCDKSGEVLASPTISIPTEGIHALSFDFWFVDGDYQGDDETAGISISSDGGSTWTALADFTGSPNWQSSVVVLDAYAGLDVTIGFTYDDGGGWNYALAIDNVSVDLLPELAASNDGTNLPEIYATSNGGLEVKAVLYNSGSGQITDAMFHYQVEGEPEVSEMVSGLTINSFESVEITHPTLYLPGDLGDKTITTWFTNLNGSEEMTNNTSGDVQMVAESVEGFVLSETFTSNTCGPCAAFNPTYSDQLSGYDATTPLSNVVAIKYQTNWPAPGTDVCYNSDAEQRITAYGINGVPSTLTQGQNPEFAITTWADYAGEVGASLADLSAEDAFLGMDVTAVRVGNDIAVSVDLNPKANFDAGNVLYVAIVNNEYTSSELDVDPTNGETEFDRVMRKMLPDGNGTALDALVLDETQSFSFEYEVTLGGAAQSNFNLVNDDISVIAFVQNPTTNVVRMAKTSGVPLSTDDNILSDALAIGPNPVSDVVNMRVKLDDELQTRIQITDALGKVVIEENLGARSGDIFSRVDVSTLDAGLYNFTVIAGSMTATRKITVIK